MKIEVKDPVKTKRSTISKLYVDGKFECYTLEDCCREVKGKPVSEWKVDKKTAIPSGVYKVIIDLSSRFKRLMPHILDVEGFKGVRIHTGNHDGETEGCIIVGDIVKEDWVGGSRDAYDVLFCKIKKARDNKKEVTIDIKR